ncbi:MAG: triple tyrosine motif-containing protein, partial [Gemmatimonadota bacterium]
AARAPYLNELRALTMARTRDGALWAGTEDDGLFVSHDSGRHFDAFDWPGDSEGGIPSHVTHLEVDDSGNLWVTTFDEGLYRINANGEARLIAGPGGGAIRILTSLVDSRGTVWIGTEGSGIRRMREGGVAEEVGLVDGDYRSRTIASILEDADRQLWLATNNGVVRLNPVTGESMTFREAAGIAGNRFYANSAYKDEATGLLYFGGPNGVTIVDPSRIEKRNTPPPVALTALQINGDTVPVSRALTTGGLRLAPRENFFAFSFAALDFTDVTLNRYEYQLDPLDERWRDNGNYNVANYTAVKPGHYTFRVRARNAEGVWNNEGLQIPVFVAAPWYKTIWAQSAAVALVLSLISALYWYRLWQLRERQALRLRIAGRLHDDIGANLAAMSLKADMVRTAEGLDERRRKQLEDLSRLARETAHQVRETVWVVNTQYDTLAGLVSKMRDTADVLLGGRFDVTFRAPEALPQRRMEMEVRQDIYLLFKESLQNIVKHSEGETVQVDVSLVGSELRVRVEDDGKGFDPNDPRLGNGLGLMKQRATRHHGRLTFTSRPSDGTVVELAIPIR